MNSSANAAGPVSIAAASRYVIWPRWIRSIGIRNSASEPKRSAVKKIGGNWPTPIFEAIRFRPQMRFIADQQREIAPGERRPVRPQPWWSLTCGQADQRA